MNSDLIVGIITFLMILIMYLVIFKATFKNVFKSLGDNKDKIYKVNKYKYMNRIRIMKFWLYFISGLLTYCSIVMDSSYLLTLVLIAISTLEAIDNLIQYFIDSKFGC